jgi:hypothetical protein
MGESRHRGSLQAESCRRSQREFLEAAGNGDNSHGGDFLPDSAGYAEGDRGTLSVGDNRASVWPPCS